ncbi:MAG TPA: hypothetical protein PL124_11485 [Candidatus Cloacimonadota bacterium]|nr:hypothetical protein [Candidatus Cloacimonadota bacterium]
MKKEERKMKLRWTQRREKREERKEKREAGAEISVVAKSRSDNSASSSFEKP